MKRIKVILLNYAKRHHCFMSLLRFVRGFRGKVRYLGFYFTNRVDDKLIVFESYMGRQYACNPKAIYEEILRDSKYNNYRFVWAFRDVSKYFNILDNERTAIVKYGSKEYYKYYAKALYWVTNSRLNESIIKKKNQVYIQCWHGTPLKKLGYDIDVVGGNAMNSLKDIRNKYRKDSKRYSYMISPSAFCTEKFSSAFKLKDNSIIKELGYPRNDFLYKFTNDDVSRVKSFFCISKNKKVILYAPTWRDDQHKSGVGYTYRVNMDFDNLKKSLADDYVILFRAHYFVANEIDFSKYEGFIYNVSDYDEINDLYIISDLLITDYSSVFFDYANLKRPIIFYMYDYEEYKHKLRDFYIDFKELPGKVVKEEKDLVKAIRGVERFKYDKKYERFNNKYTYLDDGCASKRVVKECIR